MEMAAELTRPPLRTAQAGPVEPTRLHRERRGGLWAVGLLCAATLLLPGSARATTYHVSPQGNDASAGTEAQPWATFDRAWTSLARGDTLVLLDGTYYQSLAPVLPPVDLANPTYITIRAKNDGAAVIDGQGVRVPVEFADYRPNSSHTIVEGIVARNGPGVVFNIRVHHVVIRRASGYNAGTDANSAVFSVWADDVLLEDCVASGTGRKMFLVFRGMRNTLRRCFALWQEWQGRAFCDVWWPYGSGLEIYDASDNTIENSIGYANAPAYQFYLKTDNPQSVMHSSNNRMLGNMAIMAGRRPDGGLVEWPGTRPPSCTWMADLRNWHEMRAGFVVYPGGPVRDNLWQDNLSHGNGGPGLAVVPCCDQLTGNVLRRATMTANGMANPDSVQDGGRWGGTDVDVTQEDLGKFATVEDSRIDRVFVAWPNYPTGERTFTSQAGTGARLRFRYVDGVYMDGTNLQPAQPLWPWPMEQRIQDELGVSVTNLLAGIVPDQVPAGPCSYEVTPPAVSFGAAGGTATLAVTAGSGCSWGSNSGVAWASLVPGGRSGTGTATLTVAPNTETARATTLTIAGRAIPVSQSASEACSYAVSPASVSAPAPGATTTLTLTTTAGCAWTAASGAAWATVSTTAGSGSSSIGLTVSANAAAGSRATALTIAGQTVAVSQAGAAACVYTVSRPVVSIPAQGGAAYVGVRTDEGCAWTASTSGGWAAAAPAAGVGSATITVTAPANATSSAREAIVTIGGQPVQARQAAAAGAGALAITGIRASPSGPVERLSKLELEFDVQGTAATTLQWPYDPAPPSGIPAAVGISVHAVFTDPDGRQFVQPAFYSQAFLEDLRDGRDWHLPTGSFSWRVRFSPNRVGTWHYRLAARDRLGFTETADSAFLVTPSTRRGFVQASEADSRYFEFEDGTLFAGTGFQFPEFLDDPIARGAVEYRKLGDHGVSFVRLWLSSIYGSAWATWLGGRNQYRGYLPVAGLLPVVEPETGETRLKMRIDYEPAGDTDWFDACRMQFWNDPESVKPRTTYRLRVAYRAEGLVGPRVGSSPGFGLVAKMGGWHPDCYEPGTGTPVTSYGGATTGTGHVEGTWYSGENHFLPRLHLALENVREGVAYVESVSLREDLGGGLLGPETMIKPSMEHHLYVPDEKAHAFDEIVELAERHGVYLKLVLADLNDKIYLKLRDDGSWVLSGPDNLTGFYGTGRTVNKTRWLQQMWWRYAQARWGYSPNIHSWELTNEGDPSLPRHYELADEFGKFMRCRVFDVEPGEGDGARCTLQHPNRHMVTTSFWQWFPAAEFWANPKYPNLDYADLHAYVSTSFAPLAERERMQWDGAEFHTWHSRALAELRVGKPIVRGEAGLDAPDAQDPLALGLARDTTGVWLHNFLWAGLDSGGLHEVYWWNTHLWDGAVDRRGHYRDVARFMSGLPLNKGGYEDWGGTVSNPGVRVVGQKSPAAGAAHLWVQNRGHTWKNVVDGASVAPVSAEILVPGFTAGADYTLERWATTANQGRPSSAETVVADAQGRIRIVVNSLATDVAFKVSAGPRPPSNLRIVP